MGRSRVQLVVRLAALAFVLAWLFVDRLQEWVPFWLPFVVLLATEVEFVLRGRGETPRRGRRRAPPGPEDADLGFGELVEDEEGGPYWLPPPSRPAPRRRRWLMRAAGAVALFVLFALAARADRAATWQGLPSTPWILSDECTCKIAKSKLINIRRIVHQPCKLLVHMR
jgi:hypothetical protein